MLLDDIKTTLRVSHNALDNDISDLIEEARHDLMLSGVSSKKANDDIDPLIKRAIKHIVKQNSLLMPGNPSVSKHLITC